MRILFLVLVGLFCFLGTGMSIVIASKLDKNVLGREKSYSAMYTKLLEGKSKMESVTKKEVLDVLPEYQSVKQLVSQLPSPTGYTIVKALGLAVLPLLAVSLFILTFMKKSAINLVAPVLIVLSLVFWYLAPETGAKFGDPKPAAKVVLGLMAVLSLVSVLGYFVVNKKEKGTVQGTPELS